MKSSKQTNIMDHSRPHAGKAVGRERIRLRETARGYAPPTIQVLQTPPPVRDVASLGKCSPVSTMSARQRLKAKGHKFPSSASEPLPHVRTLSQGEIKAALFHIHSQKKAPLRNEVCFLLSIDCGLSAPEIAALRRVDIRNGVNGEPHSIIVRPRQVNHFEMRIVDVTIRLRHALNRLLEAYPAASHLAFADRSSVKHKSAAAIDQWFCYFYDSIGLVGATARSGPTTYRAAQNPELMIDSFQLAQERFRSAPTSWARRRS